MQLQSYTQPQITFLSPHPSLSLKGVNTGLGAKAEEWQCEFREHERGAFVLLGQRQPISPQHSEPDYCSTSSSYFPDKVKTALARVGMVLVLLLVREAGVKLGRGHT